MVTGWSHPITKIDDGKEVLKLELKWSEAEDETLLGNPSALNVILVLSHHQN